jgi:hypothetical protein
MLALNAAHFLFFFQIPASLCCLHVSGSRSAAWVGQLFLLALLGAAQSFGEGFTTGGAQFK